MRRIIVVVGLLALTGCTNAQLAKWLDWYAEDPTAALAYASTPEVQQALTEGQQVVLTNSQGSRWDSIARCESGGRWDHPPVTNRTGTYTGGLMIWTKAWDVYGGNEFAADAYLATKAQQIEVAERILDDNGWGAWDCRP